MSGDAPPFEAAPSAGREAILATDDTVHEITLSIGTIQYRVRRSTRAKRLSLRYHEVHGFEVVLPRRAAMHEVEPFVRGMEGWIGRVLARRQRSRSSPSPIPTGVYDGAALSFLGSRLTLRVEGISGDGRSTIQYDAARGIVHARIDLDEPVPLEQIVEDWYRYAAKEMLPERVDRYVSMLGVSRGRIAIKDARTRWGSCSSKGNLNFSWRLLLAPEDVLDYVVAHEVAHLVELNHSPRFWATLARLYPNHTRQQAWLKQHGRWLASWPYPLLGVRTE